MEHKAPEATHCRERFGWRRLPKRLLLVTDAVAAGTWRQGDSGWAWLGALEGGHLPLFQCIPAGGMNGGWNRRYYWW